MFFMCRPAAAVFAAVIAWLWCDPRLLAAGRSQQFDRPIINYRPIIGVLAQESDHNTNGPYYIPASYIKFLEGAGARVVPVRINRRKEEYRKIFSSINGLLLPGGDVDIETSQFTEASKIFYDLALKANDAGDYFPIWGVCQGFQQLSVLTAGKNLLTLTDTVNLSLPLTITPAARSSRLFRSFPKHVLQSLAEENITSNFHFWSLTTKNFSQNADLRRFYRVLSTNTVGKVEFISTMEAYHYPFYALQWHPEKSLYEWIDKEGMVHSTSAVTASFYAARFFVCEAMKNNHSFSNPTEEQESIIYNFCPVFEGMDATFVQNYYFN